MYNDVHVGSRANSGEFIGVGKESSNVVTVYRLNVNELNGRFIEALQTLFKDREVKITVTEINETDYLLRSESNRRRLLQATKNIDNGKDM
jgi:antitoxin YefM